MSLQWFFVNISETHGCFLNEMLANSKLRIDTLKNILKISESCQIFGGEGPEIRVIWKN